MSLSDVVNNAMAQSTFHGFPRVISAANAGLRLLWIVLISTSVILFGNHVFKLVGHYRNNRLITDYNPRGIPFRFPDVILCHEIPLSQSYVLHAMKMMNSQNSKSPTPFQKIMEKLTNMSKLQDSVNTITEENSTLGPGTLFWETIDWSTLFKTIGHQAYQTISRASYNGQSMNLTYKNYMTYQRNHFNCIRISVNHFEEVELSDVLSISTFLDHINDPDFENLLDNLNISPDNNNDLRLYLVPPDDYPNYESDYIVIRSGNLYDIRLKMTQRLLHNSTKRTCHSRLGNFVNPLEPTKMTRPSNFYKSCIDETIQRILAKKCGCYVMLASNGAVPLNIRSGYPACFNITGYMNQNPDTINLIKARATCYLKVMDTTYRNLSRSCRTVMPCNSTTYEAHWSFANWPNTRSFNKIIQRDLIIPHEAISLQGLSVPGWEMFLKDKNKFASVFAEIKIRPQEIYSTVATEELAYPTFSLLSEIGGCMGMYMGVSLLTISELFEFFYHIFNRSTSTNKQLKSE